MNNHEQQEALARWAWNDDRSIGRVWTRLGEAIVNDPKGLLDKMTEMGLLFQGSFGVGKEYYKVEQHRHHYRAQLATPISGDRVEVVWRCDCGVQGTTVSDLEVPSGG